jgi:RHS repeat-associated protein
MTQVSYNTSGAPGVASTPSVNFTYDTTDGSATEGLLMSVSVSGQSSESYGYDTTTNFLSSVTRTIGSRSYTTSYSYTQAGQVTQLTYPSLRAININHDSIGRLSSIVNNSDSANYLSGISYKESGQVGQWTLGTNIAESFGYNNRLQMTSQTVTQNGQTRMSLSYGYQATAGQMGGGSTAGNAGQLISVTGSIGGQTESAAYTYDNLGRLVTSNQTSNSVSAQRRFVYDRWGNRTSVYDATTGGNQIQSIALEQSGGAPTNRITSVTQGSTVNYSYDSAGNVTNDGAHSFTYDARNRLVSVDGGTTANYSYDNQSRRIIKTVGSTTTHYVWEGSKVIAEHNGSTGAMLVEYIYARNRMIAREGGSSGRLFFLYDRLSVRATITDGNGNIQGRQSHLPFGEELVGSGTTDKHKFTSYERDGESGADYAVNRHYSTAVGRFNQVDPLDGSISNPQSLSRYSYVTNMVLDKVDPQGLSGEPGSPCYGLSPGQCLCQTVPEACYGEHPPFEDGDGDGGGEPQQTNYWTGFDDRKTSTINAAFGAAYRLLINARGCSGGLAARGINVSRVQSIILSATVKPLSADPNEHGQWRVFNGQTSQRPGVPDTLSRRGIPASVFPDLQTGSLDKGDLFIYPLFFHTRAAPINSELSQAIVLIHEAIHLTGMRDTDFGGSQKEGSHNLTDLIIHSCYSQIYSFKDLAFVHEVQN